MNILLSCIGKRGYIADYFRNILPNNGKIIGTSNTAWTPGFASCDEGVILPPIASDEYIPHLMEVCAKYQIKALLSLFDPDVHKLSHYRRQLLDAGIVPVLPDVEAATIAYDKMKTFRFLEKVGIDTPLTTLQFEEAEKWLCSGKITFPAIVKPRFGFGSANTFIASNLDQLKVFFNYAPDMLIQQFIEGVAYNVDGLGDLQGQPVSIIPWKKLLSKLGETERAVTIEHPSLVKLASRLIKELSIIGPFDGDFFETGDKRLIVLELNLRFGGGYPVSHLAGADFPKLISNIVSGETILPALDDYKRGITMMKKLEVIPGPTIENI